MKIFARQWEGQKYCGDKSIFLKVLLNLYKIFPTDNKNPKQAYIGGYVSNIQCSSGSDIHSSKALPCWSQDFSKTSPFVPKWRMVLRTRRIGSLGMMSQEWRTDYKSWIQ